MPSLERSSTVLLSLDQLKVTVDIHRRWSPIGQLMVRVRCVLDETGETVADIRLDPPLDARERNLRASQRDEIDQDFILEATSDGYVDSARSPLRIEPDDPDVERSESKFLVANRLYALVVQQNLLGFRLEFLQVRRFWKNRSLAIVSANIDLARFADDEDGFPLFLSGEFMITS